MTQDYSNMMDHGAGEQAIERLIVRPYKPDGGLTQAGLVSMLAAMLVTGGLLGFAAHHIHQYFWLILLFPAGIGFVLGLVGNWCIKKGRIRNQFIGGVLGFLGGVVAMLVMHHFDYDAFQKEMKNHETLVAAIRQMTPDEKAEAIRTSDDTASVRAMIEAAEVDGFISYLNWEAAQGITISKTGSSGGAPITGIGVWIYWIVELLIVAVIAFFMTKSATAEPYSRVAADWKTPVWLGSFDASMAAPVKQAMAEGDLMQLQAYAPSESGGAVTLTAYVAPQHAEKDEVDVKIEAPSRDGKSRNLLAAYTYPAGSLPILQAVFIPPASASDSVSSENPA